MTQLKVVVNKLNRRKSPVLDFSDKSNVVDVLNKDYVFESVGEITNVLGKWNLDRDGFYTLNGGSCESKHILSPSSSLLNPFSDLINYNEIFFKNIPDNIKETKGKNVKIAIIDTGINKLHPSFQSDYITCSYNAITGDNDVNDNNGHGSHVAGLIGGRSQNNNGIIGIAPFSELIIIKGVDDDKNTTAIDLKVALQKANALNVDIINLSLDIPKQRFDIISNELKLAKEKGIIIIAAAGENGLLTNYETINCPASEIGVIGIGSFDETFVGNLKTIDKKIDFLIPNYLFWSCFNETKVYSEEKGSSMATAFITGIISLIISSSGSRNEDEIIESLKKYSVTQDQFSSGQICIVNPFK